MRLPVDVDYASEYRYRNPIPDRNALGLLITQSGETADTLAAQREMISLGSKTVAICNVVDAMVAREAHGAIYTHAGPRGQAVNPIRVSFQLHKPKTPADLRPAGRLHLQSLQPRVVAEVRRLATGS